MKIICIGLIVFSAMFAIAGLMYGLALLSVIFGFVGGVSTGILIGEIIAEDERRRK